MDNSGVNESFLKNLLDSPFRAFQTGDSEEDEVFLSNDTKTKHLPQPFLPSTWKPRCTSTPAMPRSPIIKVVGKDVLGSSRRLDFNYYDY